VVNSSVGTARGAQIKQAGMEMGGKTGTAQVARITMAQRAAGVKNEDLPWKFRHHALFVGYAPINNPRYVASVVVEHGVSGSASAAPLARDLLLKVQRRTPARKAMISATESLKDIREMHTVHLPTKLTEQESQ
jgi:penicillin-binding protein 2